VATDTWNGKKKGWKIIDAKTHHPLKIGDPVKTFRDEPATLTDWEPPRHEASTGRAYIKMDEDGYEHGYFPSVINALIVRANDANAD
jgi:hypothetical protein